MRGLWLMMFDVAWWWLLLLMMMMMMMMMTHLEFLNDRKSMNKLQWEWWWWSWLLMFSYFFIPSNNIRNQDKKPSHDVVKVGACLSWIMSVYYLVKPICQLRKWAQKYKVSDDVMMMMMILLCISVDNGFVDGYVWKIIMMRYSFELFVSLFLMLVDRTWFASVLFLYVQSSSNNNVTHVIINHHHSHISFVFLF